MPKYVILILAIFLNLELYAETTPYKLFGFIPGLKFESLSLGIGNFSVYPGQVQIDANANMNGIEFNPLLTVDFNLKISEDFSLTYANGMTLPQDGRDGSGISVITFYSDFFVSYKKIEKWHFTLGSGWVFNRVSGDGGTQAVKNGLGVDNFVLPEGSTTSYNFVTNVGTKYFFTKRWNINFQTYVYNLLESEGRNISLALTFQRNISSEDLF